jgi:hypothetical protein
VTICQAANPFGMSWDHDGILFGQGSEGIMRVSANGGTPERLVAVKSGELAHGPQMLPGGQAVLFTLATGAVGLAETWEKAQIVVQSLKSGERKTLVSNGADARYLPTGHLVYALGGVVFALRFDPRRLAVIGGPVPIVEGVARAVAFQSGIAHFVSSDNGSLIFVPGPASTSTTQEDVAFMDRQGSVQPLKLPPGPYQSPRVSPDGTHLAVGTDDGRVANVWIYDLSGTSARRQLTFGGRNRFPIWSSDGQRVAFQSDREGDLALFWQPTGPRWWRRECSPMPPAPSSVWTTYAPIRRPINTDAPTSLTICAAKATAGRSRKPSADAGLASSDSTSRWSASSPAQAARTNATRSRSGRAAAW